MSDPRVESVHVELKDFQRIRHAEINIEGLTVVCGSNNAGKTSLFRALNSLVHNSSHGDEDINKRSSEGEMSVSVDVEFKDGSVHSVTRSKSRGAGAKYLIDGELYETPGRSLLPAAAKALKMEPLPTRRDAHSLNFQRSKSLFAVDLTCTRLFDLVNELMPSKEIVTALSQMKEDSKKITQETRDAAAQKASENLALEELSSDIADLSKHDNGEDLSEVYQKEIDQVENEMWLVKEASIISASLSLAEEFNHTLLGNYNNASAFCGLAGDELAYLKKALETLDFAKQSGLELASAESRFSAARKADELDVADLEDIVTNADLFDKLMKETASSDATLASAEKSFAVLVSADERGQSFLPEITALFSAAGASIQKFEDTIVGAIATQEDLNNAELQLADYIKDEERLTIDLQELEVEIKAEEEASTKCLSCGAPIDEHGKYSHCKL